MNEFILSYCCLGLYLLLLFVVFVLLSENEDAKKIKNHIERMKNENNQRWTGEV